MAIKYVSIPERKETIAILSNTRYDAINKIDKICSDTSICTFNKAYYMPETFKATVKCHGDDVFDVEEGKREAKKKVLDNYHRSIDKRIDKFRDNLLVLNGKFFENDFKNT